jgi:hypothetical protein
VYFAHRLLNDNICRIPAAYAGLGNRFELEERGEEYTDETNSGLLQELTIHCTRDSARNASHSAPDRTRRRPRINIPITVEMMDSMTGSRKEYLMRALEKNTPAKPAKMYAHPSSAICGKQANITLE